MCTKISKKKNPVCKLVYNGNQFIEKEGQMEFWWNVSITTPAEVKHNKSDLPIWCRNTCKKVEFSCPADVSVTKKIKEKEDNYGPLIRKLQVTYPGYRFSFFPVIIGAMEAITIDLKLNIKKLKFYENEAAKKMI